MTKADKKILLSALKILKREKADKKCKSYGFACSACSLGRVYEMFES